MVFENTKNNILVFSDNCACSLDLMFFVFFIIVKNWNGTCFWFLCYPCFLRTENGFQKQETNRPSLSSQIVIMGIWLLPVVSTQCIVWN